MRTLEQQHGLSARRLLSRRNYCIVNENAGYCYVNVPKAACTSIKVAIAEHLDRPFENIQWHGPHRQPTTYAAQLADLFRFTFVRHPCDRLVSCWADWCQPPYPAEGNYQKNPWYRGLQGCSFEKFVITSYRWTFDNHVNPQSDMLRVDGEFVVDKVYRFESISDGWAELQERFGLPDLPHRRKSEHKHWRKYFTNELLQIVLDRHGEDFKRFGYEA